MIAHLQKGEIFLQPGEFYFGTREVVVKTLLGSCVAITMWHPQLRIGGMCHYLLAERHSGYAQFGLDGRYAQDALALFMRALAKSNSRPGDYEVKMFGGGEQFPQRLGKERSASVSVRNIQVGRDLLHQFGFSIKAEHLGGTGARNVVFDVASGRVWLKHVESAVA